MEPASLQVNRRARRVKTDRIDVERILHTLISWCRGERHVCSMVVMSLAMNAPYVIHTLSVSTSSRKQMIDFRCRLKLHEMPEAIQYFDLDVFR